VCFRERAQNLDRILLRNRVRVDAADERAGGRGNAAIDVRPEAERPLVRDHVDALERDGHAAGDVRDDDELVDLR
jgi:hypothetical protein